MLCYDCDPNKMNCVILAKQNRVKAYLNKNSVQEWFIDVFTESDTITLKKQVQLKRLITLKPIMFTNL